jgi:simple sugar transport system ATP-binding protein
MTSALLKMENITRLYPGVIANDNVNFSVLPGEIHALLGENGAGKSTLMNVLYGMTTPDSGQIYWNDQPVHIDSPRAANELGIGMVHQHFMLVPVFTALENIVLSVQDEAGVWLQTNQVEARVRQMSDEFGLEIDLNMLTEQMPLGMQQRVEIVKALYRGATLLILDEPTAVLTPGEIDGLFRILRQAAQDGYAIIFISHKLDEVMKISDRVTVLRDGHTIATLETAATNKQQLAELMVGREVTLQVEKPPQATGTRSLLQLDNVSVDPIEGRDQLRGVSLEVRPGEIFGIAGIDGNGQRALLEAICGLRHPSSGHIHILEQETTHKSPRQIIDLIGIGRIPEDRHRMGLLLSMPIRDNLVLQEYRLGEMSWFGWFMRPQNILSFARRLVERFDIRTPSVTIPVSSLSGGNQQKVIVAREMNNNPPVLIVANPTRGLDVGAMEYVYQQLLHQRAQGTAILLISSELEEILQLSDRIGVLYAGELMGVLDDNDADRTKIGLMMAGTRLNSLRDEARVKP